MPVTYLLVDFLDLVHKLRVHLGPIDKLLMSGLLLSLSWLSIRVPVDIDDQLLSILQGLQLYVIRHGAVLSAKILS